MARRSESLRGQERMEYQRCHAIGHRWENIPVTRPPAFGTAIDLQCENCASIRRDIISRYSGVLITRYYVYPEDYKDYERHDKAWWRASFAESLELAAREYIDQSNEGAQYPDMREFRRARRDARKEWLDAVIELAQGGPPNPSPRPATRRTRTRTQKRASP